MAALNIPVVLVAGSYLGSLSHTLTSLDALRRRHLVIKALVVNETPGSTVPMADTVTTLKRFAGSTPVVAIAALPDRHQSDVRGNRRATLRPARRGASPRSPALQPSNPTI